MSQDPPFVTLSFIGDAVVYTTVDPTLSHLNTLQFGFLIQDAARANDLARITLRLVKVTSDEDATQTVLSPVGDDRGWSIESDGAAWFLTPPSPIAVDAIPTFVFTLLVSSLSAPSFGTLELDATFTKGPPASASATVALATQSPEIVALDMRPEPVFPGQPFTISWGARAASSCDLDGATGLPPFGSKDESGITADKTFRLTAHGFHDAPSVSQEFVAQVATGWYRLLGKKPWSDPSAAAYPLAASVVALPSRSTGMASGQAWQTSDGERWTQLHGNAPNDLFAPFGANFNGTLWQLGFNLGAAYSTKDASSWKKWSRSTTPSVAINQPGCAVLGSQIFFCGGGTGDDGRTATNAVYVSTNGTSWSQVAQARSWSPRVRPALATLGAQLWLCGGQPAYDQGAFVDLWSTGNGRDWSPGPKPPWSADQLPILTAIDPLLYVLTYDWRSFDGPVALWTFDGRAWKSLGPAPFLGGADNLALTVLDGRPLMVGKSIWTWLG